MRAASIFEAGSIRLIDLPKPEINQANQVLIKTKRVGICGSDMHIFHGTNALAAYPRIIGHEVCGEVIETGAEVSSIAAGDHVVVDPISHCGKCYACRNGRPNVCRDLSVFGVHQDGGLCEFFVLPEQNILKVDSRIDWNEVVLAEPYTIGAQAVTRGNVQPGDSVFIQGAGPIGISILKMAKIQGATVIISDLTQERLSFAQESGADFIINPQEDDIEERINEYTVGEGANVVIDSVCLPHTFELSVRTASIAGNVVVLGFNEAPSSIPQVLITKKELTITGSRLHTNQFTRVIDLISEKKLAELGLISHEFPLNEITSALDFIENNPEIARKAVIAFD
ncbi:zinc-binding alcohol dehydrogenase family protein [Alteribacillus sp. HJP-4]|uniref:zinc-binding alcohol dehydrogenase family protein n=1 Tax=Alteribacillus sp. HJP-4 TaxID=2775394 RepID=UPI0035CCCDF5